MTDERGDLRIIYTQLENIDGSTLQREMGGQVVAIVGPIGAHTSHPELQDALGLVGMTFNRRHKRLSEDRHRELLEDRASFREAVILLEETLCQVKELSQ